MKSTTPMRWQSMTVWPYSPGQGGVPMIFDFEGVSELIGELSGRGPRRKQRTGG